MSERQTDRWTGWATVGGVAISLLALIVTVLVAAGTIRPPEPSLIDALGGRRLTGFGTACETARTSECVNSWSFTFESGTVDLDGHFTGTMMWSFGSKLRVKGRVTRSLVQLAETEIVQSKDPSTDNGCDYFLVEKSSNQFEGTWGSCDDKVTVHAGRIWLALEGS